MQLEFMKEPLYTLLAGITGGLVNLHIQGKDQKVTATVYKIFMAFVFGFTGALFMAPIVIEYFNISGRSEYGAVFIISIITEMILLTIVKIIQYFLSDPLYLIKILLQMKGIAPPADIDSEKEEGTDV